MLRLYILVLLFTLNTTSAKVSILLTHSSSSLVKENIFSTLFQNTYVQKESDVLTKFLEKKVNFALVRKDMLKTLSTHTNHRPYYIIGELNKSMKLLFLTTSHHYIHIEQLAHTTIATDKLSYKLNNYLSNILQIHSLSFNVHKVSMGFYSAVKALKNKKINALFMLASPQVEKKFKHLVYPYPEGFISELSKNTSLSCTKTQCSLKYYIIASERVGKTVMHNIYTKLKPLWSKNKNLLSSIGNYYIDTTNIRPKHSKKNTNTFFYSKSHKIPSFHRTPWMDVAINEAILGKGSAENIFPMLDLSYKYIRFSKGKKGITTAPNDSKMGSWCAAYICWTLDKSGYQVHPKWRMASQSFRYFKDKLYKKIKKPIFGAITLYTSKKNPRHGHVGYLFGRTPSGKNILLGGNQNNRLKFSAYPAYGFGNYTFNGFYIPIKYNIKPQDYLTKKDIYTSIKKLNIRYGIKKSKHTNKVR